MKLSLFALAALIGWASIGSALAADTILSLEEARRLALEKQPSLNALELSARALEEQSIADGAPPDPRLKLGALNFPTRNFPRERDDMTQWAISYEQMVPGGDKRRLRSEKTRAEAAQMRAERSGQANAIRRDVAIAWLSAWGAQRAERLVKALQDEYRQAIDAAVLGVSTGRGTQAEMSRRAPDAQPVGRPAARSRGPGRARARGAGTLDRRVRGRRDAGGETRMAGARAAGGVGGATRYASAAHDASCCREYRRRRGRARTRVGQVRPLSGWVISCAKVTIAQTW